MLCIFFYLNTSMKFFVPLCPRAKSWHDSLGLFVHKSSLDIFVPTLLFHYYFVVHYFLSLLFMFYPGAPHPVIHFFQNRLVDALLNFVKLIKLWLKFISQWFSTFGIWPQSGTHLVLKCFGDTKVNDPLVEKHWAQSYKTFRRLFRPLAQSN